MCRGAVAAVAAATAVREGVESNEPGELLTRRPALPRTPRMTRWTCLGVRPACIYNACVCLYNQANTKVASVATARRPV
ncbi:unnamed protein product [Trichogramma brassicae]|uniref:Uncharacterized protein n=1 Tax=Trichogramma brassicae TaxID=86971 RepID=A0A6H5I073_9HYME|nr:unnamed protein product [Trichogramma brassicae]